MSDFFTGFFEAEIFDLFVSKADHTDCDDEDSEEENESRHDIDASSESGTLGAELSEESGLKNEEGYKSHRQVDVFCGVLYRVGAVTVFDKVDECPNDSIECVECDSVDDGSRVFKGSVLPDHLEDHDRRRKVHDEKREAGGAVFFESAEHGLVFGILPHPPQQIEAYQTECHVIKGDGGEPH